MGRKPRGQRRRERREPSLANALFTTTQQRVLGFFFSQPELTFIQQELIESTGSGSGAVQRELARLVESGLVTVTTLGRQKHYQANRRAPIFEELRSIVAKTLGGDRVQRRSEAPVRRSVPAPEPEWQLIFD